MKDYSFIAEDGTKIYAVKWETEKPKAVLQIVHGMAEHILRYDEFAKYLNSRGFVVAGEDHRGHGKTAQNSGMAGYFADNDGWNKVVNDNVMLGNKLREDYPGIPFYLLGHSMGSFLTRKIIAEYPQEIKKVILSGSGDFSNVQIFALNFIAKFLKLFFGAKSKAKSLDKMSFSSMNNQFNPGRTGFEWLSRDESKIDEYVADPLCGFVASFQFYNDFADGIKYLKDLSHLKKTPTELPILFYSGDKDPVGGNTKLIKAVYNTYKDTNHSVEIKFNKDGRHESLNEINRQEVYKLFADWLEG